MKSVLAFVLLIAAVMWMDNGILQAIIVVAGVLIAIYMASNSKDQNSWGEIPLLNNQKQNMKKTGFIILCALMVFQALITPYAIGRIQHNNVVRVIQNFGSDEGECTRFASDADIEEVLAVFNFPNVDALGEPTFWDYYMAGVITIEESY